MFKIPIIRGIPIMRVLMRYPLLAAIIRTPIKGCNKGVRNPGIKTPDTQVPHNKGVQIRVPDTQYIEPQIPHNRGANKGPK